jgi:hypothetical protein
LLPSNLLTKALHYALERREGLSVYLDDPDVPIVESRCGAVNLGQAYPFRWAYTGRPLAA